MNPELGASFVANLIIRGMIGGHRKHQSTSAELQ
jgi:hypothetical protein